MPAMRYTLSAADYVSDEMRAALRRRLHELVGAVLLGVAGTAAVALATWSVQDPSLSHATNAPVRNMLGLTGAASADLMMQLLGIATIAFLFPVAAWGWRLSRIARSTANARGSCCGCSARSRPRASPRACRRARRGRCRPGLAAWSAMRCCARPPGCSARRSQVRRDSPSRS